MKFKEALEELDRKREEFCKEECNTDDFSTAVKIVVRRIDIFVYFGVLFFVSKISASVCSYFIEKFFPENIKMVCGGILGCLFGFLYIMFYKKIRDNILGLKVLDKYSVL